MTERIPLEIKIKEYMNDFYEDYWVDLEYNGVIKTNLKNDWALYYKHIYDFAGEKFDIQLYDNFMNNEASSAYDFLEVSGFLDKYDLKVVKAPKIVNVTFYEYNNYIKMSVQFDEYHQNKIYFHLKDALIITSFIVNSINEVFFFEEFYNVVDYGRIINVKYLYEVYISITQDYLNKVCPGKYIIKEKVIKDV